MSARIDSIYLTTQEYGGANIYTVAGGFTEIPTLPPGAKYNLTVEINNITGGPLPLIGDVRVQNPRKHWHQLSDGPVPAGDSAWLFFPPKLLVDGLAEEPWIEMPKRNVRVIVEAHASPGGRQQRLSFIIPWGAEEIPLETWMGQYARSEEERREEHFRKYGNYDVPERQYRRRQLPWEPDY